MKAGPRTGPRLCNFLPRDLSTNNCGVVGCLCVLAFNACEYEVPITQSPTRKVQEQLLGNWVSLDGKENMRVRRLDDSTYVVYYEVIYFALITPISGKWRWP